LSAIAESYRAYNGRVPITRSAIKLVAALRDAKGRSEQGLMLLEGPRLLAEGLKAGVVRAIYVASDYEGRDAVALMAKDVPIEHVAPSDLDRMVDVRTPAGVAAVARLNRPLPAPDLVARSGRLLFLESVQDPGNVGTLARTAWALGVDALLLGPGTADPTAPKTMRASAGTLITMPHARDVSIEDLMALVRGSGHRVVVSDPHEGADYRTVDPGGRWILVASNEGAGTALPLTDPRIVAVGVPLERGAESLNVGAAVAILLAAFRKPPA
jgi:TrmH family RNA methyltransferase